jgi:hypothetical protein
LSKGRALFKNLTPDPSPTSSALRAPSPKKKEKGIGFLAYLEKAI